MTADSQTPTIVVGAGIIGTAIAYELQKRGRYRTGYEGTTLRENLYGKGQTKVLGTHPAAAFRGAYAGRPSAADTPARQLAL